MTRFRFSAVLLALLALLVRPLPVVAQSLRGSMESVERMYDHAVRDGLTFYENTNDVQWAAARGELVQLHTNHGYELHRVAFPYVRPATLTFVERLAADYDQKCGAELVVTSGVRPASRQPRNSSQQSVHPTGMAVDLHKPTDGHCLTWLRRELLALEGTGVIEATEEHHPAHFHVAVFGPEYMRFAAIQAQEHPTTPTVMIVARTASVAPVSARRYKVRVGDTLWSIAQQHSTSVDALIAANRLASPKIRAGQMLVIPSH